MRKLFVLTLVLSMLMTSCGRVEVISTGTTTPTDSEPSTIPTIADDITETEIISDSNDQTEEPDITTEITTEEITTTTLDPVFVEMAADFEFPEEFYEEFFELLAKAEVNPECTFTFDLPEEEFFAECGCDPMALAEGDPDSTGPSDGTKVPEQRVVSIYYKDLVSGYEFFYNPYPHVPVASVIKLPFLLYVCEKIENGEYSLEDEFEYKEEHFFEGTGIIKEEEFGKMYTLEELLMLSMEKSDNVAYEMLKDYIDSESFMDYLIENGVEHFEDYRNYKIRLCSKTAGRYAQMLYEYLSTGTELSQKLREWLKTSEAILATTKDKTLLHKYGWADIAFNDAAYIECDYPYVIGYATNLEGTWDDFGLLRKISLLFEEYHDEFYTKILEEYSLTQQA